MQTKEEIQSAFKTVQAIAEAIREVKEIPSGHLYAQVMGKLSLDQYNQILSILKGAGLIQVDGFHLIKWIAPDMVVKS